ncbi:MAG: hypothetical protein ABF380_04015 [Akkermansiaceae bacterium]
MPEVALRTAIHEFVYDDNMPWPIAADYPGHSLTMAYPVSGVDHSDATTRRASVALDGSPGSSDSISLEDWLVVNGLLPGDELTDSDGDRISAIIEYVTVSISDGEFVFSFEQARSASDGKVQTEFSDDLNSWTPGITVSRTPIDEGKDQVVVRPIVEGGTKKFARLRVVSVP